MIFLMYYNDMKQLYENLLKKNLNLHSSHVIIVSENLSESTMQLFWVL